MPSSLTTLELDAKDVVTFPFCSSSKGSVRDELRQEELDVNSVAAFVVGRCDGKRPWENVVDDVARAYGIPREQASTDLYEFIEAADARHLLRVKRRMGPRLKLPAIGTRLFDLAALRVARLERRRYRPTARGCLTAALYACRLPLVLAGAVVPLLLLTLTQEGVPVAAAVTGALVPLGAVLFVALTILTHEMGHLMALPTPARACSDVCARNLQVVVRPPEQLGRFDTRLMAACGPVAGLLTGLLAAALLWYAGPDLPGLPYLPIVIGVAHLASLAPWASDGRALFSGGGHVID
jgi:hypothetical protein